MQVYKISILVGIAAQPSVIKDVRLRTPFWIAPIDSASLTSDSLNQELVFVTISESFLEDF